MERKGTRGGGLVGRFTENVLILVAVECSTEQESVPTQREYKHLLNYGVFCCYRSCSVQYVLCVSRTWAFGTVDLTTKGLLSITTHFSRIIETLFGKNIAYLVA